MSLWHVMAAEAVVTCGERSAVSIGHEIMKTTVWNNGSFYFKFGVDIGVRVIVEALVSYDLGLMGPADQTVLKNKTVMVIFTCRCVLFLFSFYYYFLHLLCLTFFFFVFFLFFFSDQSFSILLILQAISETRVNRKNGLWPPPFFFNSRPGIFQLFILGYWLYIVFSYIFHLVLGYFNYLFWVL